jgi:hypothetical protein
MKTSTVISIVVLLGIPILLIGAITWKLLALGDAPPSQMEPLTSANQEEGCDAQERGEDDAKAGEAVADAVSASKDPLINFKNEAEERRRVGELLHSCETGGFDACDELAAICLSLVPD